MAKDSRQGSAKVRIFFAEVEGGDETIQDGLRTLGSALVRACQPQPLPRPVKALPPATLNGKAQDPTLFDQPSSSTEAGDDNGLEDFVDEEQGREESRTPKEQRNRKPPSYSFVKDLNLRPDGKPSLRAFFEEKAPDGQQEEFTVILYYLVKVLEHSGVGPDHIYTCFHEVEKKTPSFIPQAARNISKRKGWIDSSDGDNLRMTVKGENFVKHDLPRQSIPE